MQFWWFKFVQPVYQILAWPVQLLVAVACLVLSVKVYHVKLVHATISVYLNWIRKLEVAVKQILTVKHRIASTEFAFRLVRNLAYRQFQELVEVVATIIFIVKAKIVQPTYVRPPKSILANPCHQLWGSYRLWVIIHYQLQYQHKLILSLVNRTQ